MKVKSYIKKDVSYTERPFFVGGKNMFQKVANYCKESYDELVHKVSWPTRKELSSSAVVVLYASLLIALVVFLMDSVFQFVMEDIIYPH